MMKHGDQASRARMLGFLDGSTHKAGIVMPAYLSTSQDLSTLSSPLTCRSAAVPRLRPAARQY